ncbi:MAG: sigma-70 family RNA polymerase sigma factor [Planctomycetes bacterium]|nr:sigma-70 family RNA polymerase sigma factor [Planctomycetota bacterium]MCB9869871.1 sigma-70 family RNA polymerase sigma factor [Planctomycetota bacterium]MCB9889101.1 sigma-70 family RNA polymerase sigma factor [Planctomycetota bacterium]
MNDPRLEQTALLLSGAQAGDPGAAEELFRRYLPRVRRIVAARMGSRLAELVELDDILQETFLDACRSPSGWRGCTLGSFYNWLARSVENNIADQWRRARAAKRGSMRVRHFADLGATTHREAAFAGGGETPSRVLGNRELDARLERALLLLRDEFREVVILRILCEMSFEEIAAELQASEPTVRQWLSRALRQMRMTLGDSPHIPGERAGGAGALRPENVDDG